MGRTYIPAQLRDLPALSKSQCCDLKLDTDGQRVWLCRVGGGVTIEYLDASGRWRIEDGDCYQKSAEGK